MKKLLLSLGTVIITSGAFASNWQRSETALSQADISQMAGQQKKVVVKNSFKLNTGWFKAVTTDETTGYGYFATCDTENPESTILFSDEFVYTMMVSEDGQSFTFLNYFNLYPPKAIDNTYYNTVAASKVENIEDAGYFKIHNSITATNNTTAGRYLLRATNHTTNHDHLELHFTDSNNTANGINGPMYYQTGDGGLTNPWHNDRTSSACLIYEVEEVEDIANVTLHFTGLNDESLTTSFLANTDNDISDFLSSHSPEYFTATGVTESNTTITKNNNTFHVTGTWNYPFALNTVFRADNRKSDNGNHCTKWTVQENGQISTRNNANADKFLPENLFYFKGHGYDSHNRLTVTLHSIALDDAKGYNGDNGTFTETPTQFIVKTNEAYSHEGLGISLQHPDNSIGHLNDVSGHLAIWSNDNSQNDGGSYIRFFDLTDADFAKTYWTNGDATVNFNLKQFEQARTDRTPDNIRKLFYPDPEAPVGATLVPRDGVAQYIVDGAVIALQCKDNNGGVNTFFNGPAVKSQTLGYEQLYQVIAKGDGFILKRLSNDKYVGKSGNDQIEVEAEDDAAIFTAAAATLDSWTTKPAAIDPATAPTIRFTTVVTVVTENGTTSSSTHLNSHDATHTPEYRTGTGGYSGWFVYTFTPEQVEQIKNPNGDSYQPTEILPANGNYKIAVSSAPATELTPGWYALYNCGRQGYVKQQGNKLYMQHLADESGMGTVEDFAPYIFYVDSNHDHYQDAGSDMIAIHSAYGNCFYYLQSDVMMIPYPNGIQYGLIGNATDIFYLKDVSTGKVLDSNAIGNNVVGYGTTVPTEANNGNNNWKFFKVSLFTPEAVAVNATVNLTNNGHVVKTETVTNYPGVGVHLETPDFFGDNINITIPETDGATVEVALTEVRVPFAYTATADNEDDLLWQAIKIKPDQSGHDFIWTYNAVDGNPNKLVTDIHGSTAIGFSDEQLWAIVGNPGTGFKIYNKAAGMDKCLYKNGSNVIVGNSDENNIWKLKKGNGTYADNNTYCCFYTETIVDEEHHRDCINLQISNTELKFWSNDVGSTHYFVAAAEPLLTQEGHTTELYVGPENAVGALKYNGINIEDGKTYFAAAKANKYDYTAAKNLRDYIVNFNSTVTHTPLKPNGFYRIVNINFPDNYMFTDAESNNVYASHYDTDEYRSNLHTIFQFEPVPDRDDRYYLKSQGLYMGHVTGTGPSDHSGPVQVSEIADRGEYSLVQEDHDDMATVNTCAAFALKDLSQNNYNSLHQGSDAGTGRAQISAWREFAHGSHFYVVKAEDIEVTLDQTHDGMNVGFGYFPFAVSATDSNTKFYCIHESTDKKTGAPIIAYSEVETVAPHTPVMIGNKSSGTVILAIDDDYAAPARARRRTIAADGDNTMADGTQEQDHWTSDSWTKAGADNVPAEITALGVVAGNVRYMQRSITFEEPGRFIADFRYTSGNERLNICGIAIIDAEGNVVNSDYHIGYSGWYIVDTQYSVKVPAAGTYTLRYYAFNADNQMSTNGTIYLDFDGKEKMNILAGSLRETNIAAGDYRLGDTTDGLGLIKVTAPTPVYVYVPADNINAEGLAGVNEIPLVNHEKNTTTDIEEINADRNAADSGVIFDLQGRRLAAPVKGINIINGAKVLVK